MLEKEQDPEQMELFDDRREDDWDEFPPQEPDEEDDDQQISRSFSRLSGYRPLRHLSFRNSFRFSPPIVRSVGFVTAVPEE